MRTPEFDNAVTNQFSIFKDQNMTTFVDATHEAGRCVSIPFCNVLIKGRFDHTSSQKVR
jgi:hypothetical protein